MAYNKTTKTLSSQGGISLPEVSACLGVATLDLGTLCSSDKIRIWAKHKPVKLPALVPLSDAEKRAINYGLKLPLAAQGVFSHFKDIIGHPEFAWTYERPIGGLDSPYRLADFVSIDHPSEGYNHNCQFPPFYAGTFNYDIVFPSGGSLLVNPYSSGVNGAIQYSDLGMFEDWHLGIAVEVVSKYDGNKYWYYKTSESTLASAPHISFTKEDADELYIHGTGIYPFHLFLAKKKGDKTSKNILHLYNPTASGNDHSDNEFKPMLFDDIKDTMGAIQITGSTAGDESLNTNVVSAVAADTSNGTPFPPDVEQYTRILTVDDEWDYSGSVPVKKPDSVINGFYMQVTSTISLKVRISNTSSTSRTISVGGSEPLKVRITSGLSRTISPSTPLVLTPSSITSSQYVSGSPYTKLTSITIPANDSTEFIINLPANSMLMDNTGIADPDITSGTRTYLSVTFLRGDTALTSFRIRIKR